MVESSVMMDWLDAKLVSHGTSALEVMPQLQEYNAHASTSTVGKATQHYKRHYPTLPHKLNNNLLLNAVHKLFAEVVSKNRQHELGVQAPCGNIMYQYCYRTKTYKQMILPGPEGAHVNGASLGMIMVARRRNTRIWSPDQATGKPTPQDLESGKMLHHWRPSEVFDTLFFLDESVAHETLAGKLDDSGLVKGRLNEHTYVLL